MKPVDAALILAVVRHQADLPPNVPENPLQRLFLRAWTTPGFASSIAERPHAALAELGIAIAADVAISVYGWRADVKHLCWTCQLAIPGVYIRGDLGALFSDARGAAFAGAPRDALAKLGFALTANIRVAIEAAAAPALELQLCEAFHACVCATPELEPFVFATWPG